MNHSIQDNTPPQEAFFQFANLVGILPRLKGAIEKHFLDSFSLISERYAERAKLYFTSATSITHKIHISSTTLLRFMENSSTTRSGLESKLSNLSYRSSRLSTMRLAKTLSESKKKSIELLLSDWNEHFYSLCGDTTNLLHGYFESRSSCLLYTSDAADE